MENKILKEEANPYGTFQATVESDGSSVYLYLNPDEGLNETPRAVWVMNLVKAPDRINEAMFRGGQPLRSKSACAHPAGLKEPSAESLDLVWFPEGSGVSLFLDGEIAAVIPPFSGQDGFFGFSDFATGPESGTFPMSTGMRERAIENLHYWNQRATPKFWPTFRDALIADYESAFGKMVEYFPLDGGKFPAMGLGRFKPSNLNNLSIFASIGMSAQNMPGVEGKVKNPEPLFRIELITVRPDSPSWFLDSFVHMTLLPWRTSAWIGPGHSIEFGRAEQFSDFLIGEAHLIQEEPLASLISKIPERTLNEHYPRTFMFALPASKDDFRVHQVKGRQHVFSRAKLLDRFSGG